MPTFIVSDRDPVFTSSFWREFFRLQGTSLKMSTSYHGQSEIVNKCLETYLRCFSQDRPTHWHASIKLTPYEVVYGVPPPRLLTYVPGTTQVDAVEEVLRIRQQILTLLQHNLQHAQQRMKRYSDLKRTERSFEVGQMVYLRLQPYKQSSVAARRNLKLSPRFMGLSPLFERSGLLLMS